MSFTKVSLTAAQKTKGTIESLRFDHVIVAVENIRRENHNVQVQFLITTAFMYSAHLWAFFMFSKIIYYRSSVLLSNFVVRKGTYADNIRNIL